MTLIDRRRNLMISQQHYIKKYFKFYSTSTFTLEYGRQSYLWNGTMQYSLDNINWNIWDGTLITANQLINSQYQLYLRGINNTRISGKDDEGNLSNTSRFILDGTMIYCDGNISCLLDYQSVKRGIDPAMDDYCFSYLFYNNLDLGSVPILPSKTLSKGCYFSLFSQCRYIQDMPELPATTIYEECYQNMFKGCTRLQTIQQLPALVMQKNCYYGMFSNCPRITTTPNLLSTSLAEGCYQEMFYNCTSIVTVSQLLSTVLLKNCYKNMFNGCSALQQTPIMNPSSVSEGSCYGMFTDCILLSVLNLTLPAVTLAVSCYENMFYGCSVLNSLPNLSNVNTLAEKCYSHMYTNCISLQKINSLDDKIPSEWPDQCCEYMYYGCSSLVINSAYSSDYSNSWGITLSGSPTFGNNWNSNMFGLTGGNFTSDPEAGTNYFTKEVVWY